MARGCFLFVLIFLQSVVVARPEQEFRAVWIATVDNIDWPSKKGIPAESQKTEFICIPDLEKDSTLIPQQIELIRNTPNKQGMIFFSSKTFNKNPDSLNDSLRLQYFKEPAIEPQIEWLPKKK